MKRKRGLLFLVLALTVVSGTSCRSTRLVDRNGKRLAEGEPYLARLTYSNKRTVAYRKTPEDVAALVQELRENGATDSRLLEPDFWLSSGCQVAAGVCSGKCGGLSCRPRYLREETARASPSGIRWEGMYYCSC